MTTWVFSLVAGLFLTLFSAMLAYFISTRNFEIKMNTIAKTESEEILKNHIKINHQDSMYIYVETEISKHNKSCGIDVRNDIDKIDNKLHHMELKEVKNGMLLKSVAKMVSSISKKMNLGEIDIPADDDN